MADAKPWQRRIIICCDGTWQSSVSSTDNVPSNVTRLCRLIARIGTDSNDPSKKFHQLVYYDSGIGTGNLSTSERRRQGGVGAGLTENVIEAYNFIVLNYEPGDEIFCFGFSRGAYTARAVAGLVTDIGVIKPIDMQVFPQIYRAYQTNQEGRPFRETQAWRDFVNGKLSKRGKELGEYERQSGDKEKAQSWEIHPHGNLAVSEESRRVKVVGVWDTVGSLGIPDVAFLDMAGQRAKYGFHNVRLNGYIEHAFQALALDERRKAFRPTLWYIPQELLEGNGSIPELKQVWFPGVHINCGGGNSDAISELKGDLEHIATTSFCWMLQCISRYLTIDRDAFLASMAQYQRFLDRVRYACNFHHPNLASSAIAKLPRIPLIRKAGLLDAPKRSSTHQHPDLDFGYGTGPVVDSYTGMYHLAGSMGRLPGRCEVEIYDDWEAEYVLKDVNGYGRTNEYIHPVCYYRDLVRGPEKNSPLRHFERIFQASGSSGPPSNCSSSSSEDRAKQVEGDARGRFWYSFRRSGKDVIKFGSRGQNKIPEWIIMPHGEDGKLNFERVWYGKCEKTTERLELLRKRGFERDWLEMMDERWDFRVGKRKRWAYP
ncbi:hypothetical protein M011DRAFT_437300 [Sporormia fimetaria CBS 119925]|uniref:T6SS Phospholipase effector Tle1-like catalytic domain-containing protein n=1 Tax=Sporormia fimetaria CBS 119925 TaxID=1340428 RepID=A0A6A6VJM7_9PLEO|nr:hypothetical protein M011DRAFT_437300 [Sporormia fimetaria CBS 119925]